MKKLAWNATFRKLRPWHLVPSLHGKWMGKQWKKWQALFFGLQNHCSYEIIRCLLIGRKVMTNLDSILRSRVITLPTNSILSKLCCCFLFFVFFSVVIYGCKSWSIKKAECQRIDDFELWCWTRLLKVPWTSRKYNLKEISPEYSLGGLMLKQKLQYFGHLMQRLINLNRPWN